MNKKQRGNILFLILLAVVLFAALTYAITSSTQGGGKSGKEESAQAAMAEILNFYSLLDTAVQRMLLTGGVKDYELNFQTTDGTDYITGSYSNPNCTTDKCRVFHPDGGGITGKNMIKAIQDPSGDVANTRVFYYAVPGAGTDKPDIVFATYNANIELCRALNKRIGLNDFPYGVGFSQTTSNLMYYNSGAIATGPIPDNTGTPLGISPAIGSQHTFCFCKQANWTDCEADIWEPMLFHVVLAR